MPKKCALALLVCLFLTACSLSTAATPVEETVWAPDAIETTAPTPWVLVQSTAQSKVTSTPLHYQCSSTTSLKDKSTFDELPCAIMNALNQPEKRDLIEQQIKDSGVNLVAFVPIDINKDDHQDLVVSIGDPSSPLTPPSGDLLVYLCGEKDCSLAYIQPSAEGFSAPRIYDAKDLKGEQKNDLLVGYQTCGAHTCYVSLAVLEWNGAGFTNLLVGNSSDLPNPQVSLVNSGGPVMNIQVHSDGVGSVGAGPQRVITRIWKYDSTQHQWEAQADSIDTSKYRIHAVQDADKAFHHAEDTLAIKLYQQVISDRPQLLDWVDPVVERSTLAAYAAFRLVMIYTLEGNTGKANEIFSTMQSSYPSGSAAYGYVEMADLVIKNHPKMDETGLCRLLMDYGNQNFNQVLAPLGSNVFGYSNPDMKASELCR